MSIKKPWGVTEDETLFKAAYYFVKDMAHLMNNSFDQPHMKNAADSLVALIKTIEDRKAAGK